MNHRTPLLLAAACSCAASLPAGLILSEDFEDGTVAYTTSVPEFSDGNGDFFLRTDGTGIDSAYSLNAVSGTSYFAAMDLDGEGATLPLTMTFSGIDVSGYENLSFRVNLAEDKASDGNGDWDNSDSVVFAYRINGGAYIPLFTADNAGGGTNTAPYVNGIELTDTFATFSSGLSGTGSLLDIQITFDLDSGDEDIALDDLQIWGDAVVVAPNPGGNAVPEPSRALFPLTACSLLGLLARRRR